MYVLDTSILLGGRDPPPGQWATTPEAAAEIRPGGRDARRFEDWQSLGLEIRSASDVSLDAVSETGMAAGNLARLSDADRSLLALARDVSGILLTDDLTMQDVAMRMDIRCTGMGGAITETKQWKPRCSGCGRWFEEPQRHDECPICGSEVKDKLVR